jgi:hypothetical protein
MTGSSRAREVCVMLAIMAASCVGSVGLTLVLTSLPQIQSTSNGNAGQAYGAAAAAASMVVLIYIARTFRQQGDEARMHREVLDAQRLELSLQREEAHDLHQNTRRSAEAAVREQHIKLLQMAIEDPLLMKCWPSYGRNISDDRRKQYMYCNLIISHQCMCYELGYFTDAEIEESLYRIFSSAIIREFWEKTRIGRNSATPYGGKMRKFYETTELAYLRRVSS